MAKGGKRGTVTILSSEKKKKLSSRLVESGRSRKGEGVTQKRRNTEGRDHTSFALSTLQPSKGKRNEHAVFQGWVAWEDVNTREEENKISGGDTRAGQKDKKGGRGKTARPTGSTRIKSPSMGLGNEAGLNRGKKLKPSKRNTMRDANLSHCQHRGQRHQGGGGTKHKEEVSDKRTTKPRGGTNKRYHVGAGDFSRTLQRKRRRGLTKLIEGGGDLEDRSPNQPTPKTGLGETHRRFGPKRGDAFPERPHSFCARPEIF